MSDLHRWNELGEAIFRLTRHTVELPEGFRWPTEGDLCALMPCHAEIVDTRMQIQNASPFNFIITQDDEGEAPGSKAPIFRGRLVTEVKD
jgi:hypothetical protein